MELSNHPGLSEADVEAAEVLDELRKTITNTRSQIGTIQQQKFNPTIIRSLGDCEDDSKPVTREGSINLLNRVVNNVVTFYDDRRKVASIARLLDDAYEDNYTTSEDESDSDMSESESENDDIGKHMVKKPLSKSTITGTQPEFKLVNKHAEKRPHEDEEERSDEYDEDSGDNEDGIETPEERFSKRQKISEAIDNLKEYKFNMSIESKKRLITCLHLLKLANKQLSEKVTNLQELVQKEHEAEHLHQVKTGLHPPTLKKNPHSKTVSISSLITHDNDTNSAKKNEKQQQNEDEEEEEEFFDAFDSKENNEQATIIKMEVVGTIKKVYSMISKFTGSSLPEPARSQVRASLLNLPTNWSSTVSHLSATTTTTTTDANSNDNSLVKQPSVVIPSSEEEQYISTNGKVLILAKESLDMVHSVMEVVDSTLGKAEEWVKQKQEIKEVLYEKFRQTKVDKEK